MLSAKTKSGIVVLPVLQYITNFNSDRRAMQSFDTKHVFNINRQQSLNYIERRHFNPNPNQVMGSRPYFLIATRREIYNYNSANQLMNNEATNLEAQNKTTTRQVDN